MLYNKILLKLSGEAFSGDKGHGINRPTLVSLAKEIKSLVDSGIKVAVVIGGGNFWRGRDAENYDRVTADSIGMIATVMNGLAFRDVLQSEGISARVMSAVEVPRFAEILIIPKARAYMENGDVVIFSGGTGTPFFSTDTTAALRALDIKAQAIFKATLVDGVYDKDPHKFNDAVKYDSITYMQVLQNRLAVMDSTAISLCMDNKLPIHIFNLDIPGNIINILKGQLIGTIVKEN